MIKNNKRTLIITTLLLLVPVVLGLALWGRLPAQIPTHFDGAGVPDRYSSKLFAVVGLPLILLALHWVCVLATNADPKGKNISGKAMGAALWAIPVISIVMHSIMYAVALGHEINVVLITTTLVGLVLIAVGNYLPKCSRNYTVGIKLPWTLDSDDNWNRIHRLGGRVFVLGGAVILICGVLGHAWVLLPVILVMVLVPCVYSYLLYRKQK